jgi:hypothetical protein
MFIMFCICNVIQSGQKKAFLESLEEEDESLIPMNFNKQKCFFFLFSFFQQSHSWINLFQTLVVGKYLVN